MNTPDSDEFFTDYAAPTNTEDEPGILPRFYTKPFETKVRDAKGEETGETTWADREFIEINFKGNRLSTWVGLVTDEHRGRFKRAYARFKSGQEIARNGTPLEEWPIIGMSQCMMWKALNIRTVEDVAQLGDEHMTNLGIDGMGFRAKARLYLKSKKDAGAVAKVAADNAAKDKEIERLHRVVEELGSKLDRFMAGETRVMDQMPTHAKRPTLTVEQ